MGTIAKFIIPSVAAFFCLVGRTHAAPPREPDTLVPPLPGLEEVIASKVDLWGEAALRHPGGPTYDFFARLLPPLRYVDADFLHYPIVLSAPARRRRPGWSATAAPSTPWHGSPPGRTRPAPRSTFVSARIASRSVPT